MGSRSPGKMEVLAASCTATPLKGWKCLQTMASEICIWILVVLRENWPWTCTLVRSQLYLCYTRSCRPKSLAWDCLYEQQKVGKEPWMSHEVFPPQKKKKKKHKKKALCSLLQHSALTRTCKSLLTRNHVQRRACLSHKLPWPEILGL